MLTLEQLQTPAPESEQFEQELEQSLRPRSWDMLLDMVSAVGLPPDSKIIDVGCGTAYWSCRLAERLGARVLAIDVVPGLVAAAMEQVKSAGLEQRVVVREAAMHAVPVESASYDLVWCRDMLNHVRDLAPALQECCRVLRPGGTMLVYQTFAGELLKPREAERLYRALGIVPENMSTEHVEHAFAAAGLSVLKKDVIGSEWREEEVERGERTAQEGLLHAARLLRHSQAFIERYGEGRYEQALGDAQWYPFIMLGKLMPVAYLLRRSAS